MRTQPDLLTLQEQAMIPTWAGGDPRQAVREAQASPDYPAYRDVVRAIARGTHGIRFPVHFAIPRRVWHAWLHNGHTPEPLCGFARLEDALAQAQQMSRSIPAEAPFVVAHAEAEPHSIVLGTDTSERSFVFDPAFVKARSVSMVLPLEARAPFVSQDLDLRLHLRSSNPEDLLATLDTLRALVLVAVTRQPEQPSQGVLRGDRHQAYYRLQRGHDHDEDCTVDPETLTCFVCDVGHGADPCPSCGGSAYHRPGCPESDEHASCAGSRS